MTLAPRQFALAALVLPLALIAAAQDAAPPLCESPERTAAYADYYKSKSKKNESGALDPAAQKHAYEVGKQYLAKYEKACADKYTESVSKFVVAYGEASDRFTLTQSAFGAKPDPAKAFEIGRKFLAANPGDIPTRMALAAAGGAAIGKNDALVKEGIANAKTAVQEIEAGKAPEEWTPYKTREEALSFLYYYLGDMTAGLKDQRGAIPWLLKAGTAEGPAKSNPATYAKIATAYHAAVLKPMEQDYNRKFSGKYESAEGKHAYEQITQVIDRITDAYARAVHLSGDDPRYAAAKAAWLDVLKSFYKGRAGEKMAGFDAYVADAMSRPLPAVFEPKAFIPPASAKKK